MGGVGSAGVARQVSAVHTTAAFISSPWFCGSGYEDMRCPTVLWNIAACWSWRFVPLQAFGQAERWGRAKSAPKTIQKRIIYRERAAAMLPGWWGCTQGGNSGAGMSPALGDIGLRKILPTGIRIVGMDFTIPGKTCLCYTPYLI